MNHSRSGIFIPFSSSVIQSSIVCFLLITISDFCHSISIALCCASNVTCTFVSCYTSTCTFVDNCCFTATTFSSPTSFCTIYTSTKCCSTTLSSFDSSMNVGTTNVAPSLVYFFTCQHCLLLCKNSTIDVSIISMSWIIICANYIFSLYAFPSTHSKDDDECDGDLIVNNWIFNTPSFFYSSQLLF